MGYGEHTDLGEDGEQYKVDIFDNLSDNDEVCMDTENTETFEEEEAVFDWKCAVSRSDAQKVFEDAKAAVEHVF